MPAVSPFGDVAQAALDQLRHKLNAGEYTERQFARMARIAQGTLNNILQGRRRPSIAMMDRICRTARIRPLEQSTQKNSAESER